MLQIYLASFLLNKYLFCMRKTIRYLKYVKLCFLHARIYEHMIILDLIIRTRKSLYGVTALWSMFSLIYTPTIKVYQAFHSRKSKFVTHFAYDTNTYMLMRVEVLMSEFLDYLDMQTPVLLYTWDRFKSEKKKYVCYGKNNN